MLPRLSFSAAIKILARVWRRCLTRFRTQLTPTDCLSSCGSVIGTAQGSVLFVRLSPPRFPFLTALPFSFLHPTFSSLFEAHPKLVVVEVMPGVSVDSLNSTLSTDWAVINTAVLDGSERADESRLMNMHVYISGSIPVRSNYAPSGHARRLLQDFVPKPSAVSAMALVSAWSTDALS